MQGFHSGQVSSLLQCAWGADVRERSAPGTRWLTGHPARLWLALPTRYERGTAWPQPLGLEGPRGAVSAERFVEGVEAVAVDPGEQGDYLVLARPLGVNRPDHCTSATSF